MRSVIFLVTLVGYVTCVTVNTKYGDVTGQTWPLHNGKSVNSFLALPFAKPPTGQLRFAVSNFRLIIAVVFQLVLITNLQ